MPELGREYYNDYAYYIAGGKTLAAIKQYLSDVENADELTKALAREFGADDAKGASYDFTLFASKQLPDNPAYKFESGPREHSPGWKYVVNLETPEGRALRERYEDIPQYGGLSSRIFARRLTGSETVLTNPDHLRQSFGYENRHYSDKAEASAASFQKIGDTYLVSVPRVIRGIFNEESAKASKEDHYEQAAGYAINWWTPPDSTQIPYSKVIEMLENEKGDQLAPVTKKAKVPAFSDRDR